jgi:hypothetical protein
MPLPATSLPDEDRDQNLAPISYQYPLVISAEAELRLGKRRRPCLELLRDFDSESAESRRVRWFCSATFAYSVLESFR